MHLSTLLCDLVILLTCVERVFGLGIARSSFSLLQLVWSRITKHSDHSVMFTRLSSITLLRDVVLHLVRSVRHLRVCSVCTATLCQNTSYIAVNEQASSVTRHCSHRYSTRFCFALDPSVDYSTLLEFRFYDDLFSHLPRRRANVFWVHQNCSQK